MRNAVGRRGREGDAPTPVALSLLTPRGARIAVRRLRRPAAAAKARLRAGAGQVRYQLTPGRRGPFAVHSYDVFDTVLTRTVAPPTAVFLLAGRLAARRGVVVMAPGDLARARRAAEEDARRCRPSGEVSLAEIYAELGRALCLDASAAEQLRELELAVEERVLCAVPGMTEDIARARMAGAAVAFVSDMYLDSAVVAGRLAASGLFEPGDHCLLSHEHDATKASGALYDVLLGVAGCRPSRIRHIGDNLRSDVVRARARRLVADHYGDTALNRYEAILAGAGESTDGLAAAMAGASRLARLGTRAPTPRRRAVRDVAAGVAAPVLTGFVLWVLAQARARGLRRLCFVSRDGQVLLAIAQELAPRLGVDIELRYLYGGRQAWCLPTLVEWAEGGSGVPSWLLEHAASGTAAGVLARAGLIPGSIEPELAIAGLAVGRWDKPLGHDGVRRLEAAMEQPAVRRQAAAAAGEAKESLLRYLRQEGMLDGVPWGVVDLGWRGRATGALAEVVECNGGDRPVEFYLGLRAGAARPGALRTSWLFESPDRDDLVRGLPRLETLLESFAAGDHGVVLGYEADGDGRMAPVFQRPGNPGVAAWGLDTVREAVARFAEALVVDEDLVDPWADLRPAAAALLRAFWTAPTVDEADAWGAFPYEDDPRGVQVRSLAAPVRLRTLPGLLRGVTPESHWRAGQERISSPIALRIARAARAARRSLR